MKKNVIFMIGFVFFVLILAVGILSYTLISSNKKLADKENNDKVNQKVEELVEKKLQEKIDEEKIAKEENDRTEKKEAKNKTNFITAKEAFEGETQRGVSSDPIECVITAKQKRIPSNVDQKAEGGMLTCEGSKYRVYVGNDRKYNLMSVGDRYGFQVRWIESNLYYFYVDVIGGTF